METKQAKTIKRIYCSQLTMEFGQYELKKKKLDVTLDFPSKFSGHPCFFWCCFSSGNIQATLSKPHFAFCVLYTFRGQKEFLLMMLSHIYCWQECKIIQLLWKTVWQSFKQLNIGLPCDLAIPLLGIYPKEMKTYVYKKKKTYAQMFIAMFFIIFKKVNNLNAHQLKE